MIIFCRLPPHLQGNFKATLLTGHPEDRTPTNAKF